MDENFHLGDAGSEKKASTVRIWGDGRMEFSMGDIKMAVHKQTFK